MCTDLLDAEVAVALGLKRDIQTKYPKKKKNRPKRLPSHSCSINHSIQEGVRISSPLSAHFRRKLPMRLFNPSAITLGRDVVAAEALPARSRERRPRTGGEPARLRPSESPRRRCGTISYSPLLSRTDCDRPIPAASLAFRSLSMVKPGSAFPFRSSGWYC